ncbi:MAG: amino acid permease [Ignavibacteriota bacterium]|nr:amino acid permease [Ignavibacteriota bacterium]MBV6420974.1 Serine/threonine exchanger SteT [Ignavibacteriaceae bacterium]MEB2297995.1 amino acid permease [Ignavibacteria bacterium]QKJ96090.1 MAG: amino acid permease [Ignavibacteriota bacterium]
MHAQKPATQLKKSLSLIAAVMAVAGSMIGSGIFRKPSTMAEQLMSPELLIIVWIAAGLITFIGALSNAEVAGMIEATGGQYVYFRKMYGEFTSFIYGWSVLSVIQTGSQAAIAYVFGEYLCYFIKFPPLPESISSFTLFMPLVGNIHPFAEWGPKLLAILCILFLSGINYIGVYFGGLVQTIVTFVKIGVMIFLSLALFIFGDGSLSNLSSGFSISPETSANLVALIGLSLSGAFWAYDGWNNVTFISGEVKNPQRNIPLSLLYGTLIVIIVYVLINLAYLYVMPIEEIANSPLVAAAAAEKIFGKNGGAIISIAVIISTFGAANGSLMASARVPFAMAREKMFFNYLGKVHPRFATPHTSLVVQGIVSSLLVLSGSFDTITDYVIFATWFFYMLTAFGVIVLRKKMPDVPRPYKVIGYPYTIWFFVIFSFVFLVNSIISDSENAAMGMLLIMTGLPLYFFWKYFRKN